MPGKGRPKKKMRARYGTGSMKNPRPGYYELTISLGTDRNGKRIRKTVTGRSPEEVEEGSGIESGNSPQPFRCQAADAHALRAHRGVGCA